MASGVSLGSELRRIRCTSLTTRAPLSWSLSFPPACLCRRAALTLHADGGETLRAVFKHAHRPRPCSDKPPPHKYSCVYGCRNGTSLCDEHFVLFFILVFSVHTRCKEVQLPTLNLKMRLFFSPSLQHGGVAWRSPPCQGSPVMTELGRRECFPPVRQVCLGGGKITG